MEYTELHCHSYYSFLDGTSSPADLAENASRFQFVSGRELTVRHDLVRGDWSQY